MSGPAEEPILPTVAVAQPTLTVFETQWGDWGIYCPVCTRGLVPTPDTPQVDCLCGHVQVRQRPDGALELAFGDFAGALLDNAP